VFGVLHFFLAKRHISSDIAVRLLSSLFAHAGMEVLQGFKLTSLMADVKGLTAFKDVGEWAIGHFPIIIFIGRLIPKDLDRLEFVWAEFYMGRRGQPGK